MDNGDTKGHDNQTRDVKQHTFWIEIEAVQSWSWSLCNYYMRKTLYLKLFFIWDFWFMFIIVHKMNLKCIELIAGG